VLAVGHYVRVRRWYSLHQPETAHDWIVLGLASAWLIFLVLSIIIGDVRLLLAGSVATGGLLLRVMLASEARWRQLLVSICVAAVGAALFALLG
jgi:hypothetical protein